ncbi:MAG: hypothetical protein DME87_11965 [Verrucomicrobia bacterium]|nr:MAG: hypothetical protein DME87_11965 [Verrucomicrobiota bacterium]
MPEFRLMVFSFGRGIFLPADASFPSRRACFPEGFVRESRTASAESSLLGGMGESVFAEGFIRFAQQTALPVRVKLVTAIVFIVQF